MDSASCCWPLSIIKRRGLSYPDNIVLGSAAGAPPLRRPRCTPQYAHKMQQLLLPDRMNILVTTGASKRSCTPTAASVAPLSTSALESMNYNNGSHVSITLEDLQHAQSSLEEFCRCYLMFHDMSAPDFFKHFPILAIVEGYVYQIDEQYEKLLSSTTSQHKHEDAPKFQHDAISKAQEKMFTNFYHIIATQNLWTTRIEEEVKNGLNYWSLEQSLCDSLQLDKEISLSNVMQAMKFRSFDFRILNLLLYGLSNQPVNETHMKFLSLSELFREIVDDLLDYEGDVLNNSFNILRMFAKIYGPVKAPYMLDQVIVEIEEKYKRLLEELEPSLALQYQKCHEQIVFEGGGTCSSNHPMGSWTIPTLILNERMYREKIAVQDI